MLFLFTNCVILVSNNFSNTFENTGSNEIGRKSPNAQGDEILGIGITYAILKHFGKVSIFMHLLYNFVSTGVKTQLDIFTNLEGISSIPCAEFILILLIHALTSCLFTSCRAKE